MREIHQGEIYRHFKNRLYQIVAVATHSETKEKYVVYQALYGTFETYIRPYDMFMSEVDRVKYPDVKAKYRFEKVEPEELTDSVDVPVANCEVIVDTPVGKCEASKVCEIQTEEEIIVDGVRVNPLLMKFFDCDSSAEQIEYLSSIRDKVDDKLVTDIAVALDITVNDGDVDEKLSSIITCLKTKARFECGRLR